MVTLTYASRWNRSCKTYEAIVRSVKEKTAYTE